MASSQGCSESRPLSRQCYEPLGDRRHEQCAKPGSKVNSNTIDAHSLTCDCLPGCLQFYEIQHKGEGGGSLLLTEQQQQWLQIQRMLGRTNVIHKYVPPNNRLRAGVFDLVMSSWFDQLIMAVILVNVATMALNHAGQSSSWDEAISWANVAFTVVFVMEAALKLVAIGVQKYLQVCACTMVKSYEP